MVSLYYLKYKFNLSDEDAGAGWKEIPYWRRLSGMEYFENEAPIDPSSMPNWRCKVSVAATSRGGCFVGTMAVHGNHYDGHTLSDILDRIRRIAKEPLHVFVDRGYRRHDYGGDAEVHVDKPRRGRTAKSLRRWMKRRAAVEPGIGYLKREHGMDRNRLKGTEGDMVNAILSSAGMNFSKPPRWAAPFLASFCRRSSRPSGQNFSYGARKFRGISGSTRKQAGESFSAAC